MDELQLIKLLKQNDPRAFRTLVEKYQVMVIRTCFYIVRKQEDAEDIAQDVFVDVYQYVHMFREEAMISTWLYRIALNKSLNFVRKHKWKNLMYSLDSFFNASIEKPMDIPDNYAQDAPDTIEYKERTILLQRAVDSLPRNQRIAFILCKYDERSYKEIAEIMNLSISSVESLIHRAKLNLQKRLIHYYKT